MHSVNNHLNLQSRLFTSFHNTTLHLYRFFTDPVPPFSSLHQIPRTHPAYQPHFPQFHLTHIFHQPLPPPRFPHLVLTPSLPLISLAVSTSPSLPHP
ncbi:hypothetical protein EX30DRAFT_221093 [Ascodesmis nigricans]|uniref:Uncharacterized protein n=1 Tax=Ascodesmis nigricans TaxID=341454 RepID=A0A4S2MZW4_9PEZI|nr:hypothetical protein EX30DRAFT_221093 [Ascodesmis nigricans]